ncbi:hypothetical protein C8R45DRAFT_1207936 [Mycena sanguinolenta]|nr:hypothetical protein C8R45DRAFT_1207936 [Mycena sanguinolenta]
MPATSSGLPSPPSAYAYSSVIVPISVARPLSLHAPASSCYTRMVSTTLWSITAAASGQRMPDPQRFSFCEQAGSLLHTNDLKRSKMTMYDFYGVLEKLTDNTGIKPLDRYHDAVAVPRRIHRPGRKGRRWENASLEDRVLYTVFISLDACFRLKRRLVSSELKDPDLGSGWAYMVETELYREYLRDVTPQKEMNTCSGLAALDYTNTKFSRGYSTTGVGMGVCARHEFILPNGVGDLQRGERFSNMDYVLASIMKHIHTLLFKFFTYDIACIWKVKLVERLKNLPPNVRLTLVLALVRFAIPKMHINAHKLRCQLLYSLNLILGSAQVDAEAIERAWAAIGGFSYWNWQKLVGIVELLRRRRERAHEELKEQTEALEEFSAQQADRVPEWRRQVLEFKQDKTKHNPFHIEVKGLTEAEVRLQFTKEEAEEAARGIPAVHDVSPSSFISAGLDLEEEQFRKIQGAYMPTALQLLRDMDLPSTTLAEDVPLLLPSALTSVQRARCADGLEHIEALMRDAQCRTGLTRLRNQLHIKSRLLTYKKNHVRHQGANTKSRTILTRNESKIRLHSEKYQTAWEALRKLNGGDETLVGWRVLKRDDICCREDPEDLRKKEQQRIAREAKHRVKNSELRAHGILPAEVDDDMEIDDDVGRGPENRCQVSWIWAVAGTEGTDAALESALQVEWSKAFACTQRWDEEVRLLGEEFRRICVSFEHEEKKWRQRAANLPVGVLPRADVEAAVVYVLRHADMFRDLKERGMIWWTEEKLARGKKRARHVPAMVSAMEAEARAEEVATEEGRYGHVMDSVDEDVDADGEAEDEEARGDVESDEEYILGGEGYDN